MSVLDNDKFQLKVKNIDYCPLCQSKKIKLWRKAYDRLCKITNQKFIYSQCKQCGVFFLSIRPLQEEVYKLYPQDYTPYQSNSKQVKKTEDCLVSDPKENLIPKLKNKIIYKIREKNLLFNDKFPNYLDRELLKLYQPPQQNSTLLDFGCGSNNFLDKAKKLGWNGIGIDFSDNVISQVRNSGYKCFLMSDNVWDEIEDESLDFVRMSHVLEHLYQPKEILSKIKEKLKPKGKIHIIVPNPLGISAKLFRSYWYSLDCPRHTMLFSPKVLCNLLKQVGFRSEPIILPEMLNKDFIRSYGYFMHSLGFLKSDELDKIADSRDLSIIFHIPIRIISFWGFFDRFHVYLEK